MYPSMLTHAQNDVAQVRIAGGREEKKKIRLVLLDREDREVREGHSRLAETAEATAATVVTAAGEAASGAHDRLSKLRHGSKQSLDPTKASTNGPNTQRF